MTAPLGRVGLRLGPERSHTTRVGAFARGGRHRWFGGPGVPSHERMEDLWRRDRVLGGYEQLA